MLITLKILCTRKSPLSCVHKQPQHQKIWLVMRLSSSGFLLVAPDGWASMVRFMVPVVGIFKWWQTTRIFNWSKTKQRQDNGDSRLWWLHTSNWTANKRHTHFNRHRNAVCAVCADGKCSCMALGDVFKYLEMFICRLHVCHVKCHAIFRHFRRVNISRHMTLSSMIWHVQELLFEIRVTTFSLKTRW